ncbi:hypothetical protein EIP75_21660 [Aquabacterium soli]|uniref:Uncharacterized protein n=1 Tax=Aquabacterium soli TaxID=2493092 RepID=A0A3R8S5T3_9BURK|nr:hypothetical protein [Aquabacterium soli]RRS01185.1 hypothetical protein EIP75_21660 [Aquabacterium soli]
MKIELHAGGKLKMARQQQKWIGNDSMQTALFAGEEVMAITDDKGGFDLLYLGFQTGGFASLEEAKVSAPAFASAVLAHMATLI